MERFSPWTQPARPHGPRFRGVVADFLDYLQRQGRYTFTYDELAEVAPSSPLAQEAALRRLVQSGRLVRVAPRRGFFVIVPHEYHGMGAPPAAWYLDAYLNYLGLPYYVGLLTAAEWYGSAHFAVQEVHVVTSTTVRPATVGREHIRFVKNTLAARMPVRSHPVPTGTVRVSTPEATALDLVRYRDTAGGLSRVATVLATLGRSCEPAGIQAVLQATNDVANAQRLGYLLSYTGYDVLAGVVATWLRNHEQRTRPLEPAYPVSRRAVADRFWNLWINVSVETTT